MGRHAEKYSGSLAEQTPARRPGDAQRPAAQALVKSTLAVKKADDATTDDVHAGEAGYVSCIFATASGYQFTVILSEDPFVDVMKGQTFCEVMVSMPPDQFAGADWSHAAGKICVAAFDDR